MSEAGWVRIIAGACACAAIAGCGSGGSDGAAPASKSAAGVKPTPAAPTAPAPQGSAAAELARAAPPVSSLQPSPKAKPAHLPASAVAKAGSQIITKAMLGKRITALGEAVGVPMDSPKFTKCIAAMRTAQEPSAAFRYRGKPSSVQRKACAKGYAEALSDGMQGLIFAALTEQDAKAAGIKVSDAEILTAMAGRTYSRELATSTRLQLLSRKLGEHRAVSSGPRMFSEARIKAYFNQHKARYATGELRDVQVVTAKSKAAAEAAKADLAKSPPQATTTTTSRAGLASPALGKLAFSLAKGGIGGPLKADKLWYVVRVVSIRPAQKANLAQQRNRVISALRLQTSSVQGRRAVTSRTVCRAGYVMNSCGNS